MLERQLLIALNSRVPMLACGLGVHQSASAQIVLRCDINHGFSAIPKSVRPQRIAENSAIFACDLTANKVVAIDARDIGVCGAPEPQIIDTTLFPFQDRRRGAWPGSKRRSLIANSCVRSVVA